jgi:hypothetical protein
METSTKILLLAGLGAAGYYIWKSQNSGGSSSNSGSLDPDAGTDEKIPTCITQDGTSSLMRGYHPSQATLTPHGSFKAFANSILRPFGRETRGSIGDNTLIINETAFLDTIPEATSCTRVNVRVSPTPLNYAKCVSTDNTKFFRNINPSLGAVFVYKAPTGLATDISRVDKFDSTTYTDANTGIEIPSNTIRAAQPKPRLIFLDDVVGVNGVTSYQNCLWLRLAQSNYWVEASNFILVANKSSDKKQAVNYTEKNSDHVPASYEIVRPVNVYSAPSTKASVAQDQNGRPLTLRPTRYDNLEDAISHTRSVDAAAYISTAPPQYRSVVHGMKIVYGGYCYPSPGGPVDPNLNDYSNEKRLVSCEWLQIYIADPSRLQEKIPAYIPLNHTYFSMDDQI